MNRRTENFLDRLLETTVIPSFSSIGFFARKHSWNASDLEVDLTGKHYAITGANSGLGYATAEKLAELNGSVHLLVRNINSGHQAREEIVDRTGNKDVKCWELDVSSKASVRSFTARFLETQNRLDALVHNAGVLLKNRTETPENIEVHLATHVIGPFLLTGLLLPLLRKSAPSRLIWVTSGGMYTQKLDTSDLQSNTHSYHGPEVYAKTKRMQVVLAELWGEKLVKSKISVNSVHPGWVATPGLNKSLPQFARIMHLALRTPPQGADTIIWLAAAQPPSSQTGKFWFDRRQRPTHRFARTRETLAERAQLWNACCELSGLEIPPAG